MAHIATVKRCRRKFILGGWLVVVGSYKIKKHDSLESASWHAFALNSADSTRLAVINRAVEANDQLWAGRC